ncbi:DNA mismatch repair protein Mlh3 [Manis javanica]|nr:DNA mismatch repair protein Mlh3 [Manis javanica]
MNRSEPRFSLTVTVWLHFVMGTASWLGLLRLSPGSPLGSSPSWPQSVIPPKAEAGFGSILQRQRRICKALQSMKPRQKTTGREMGVKVPPLLPINAMLKAAVHLTLIFTVRIRKMYPRICWQSWTEAECSTRQHTLQGGE